MNNDFGKYLTSVRENSGFKSQRQLALEANISPATLSRIEAGTQHPQPETLKILARYLKNVAYEDLLAAAGYLNEDKKTVENEDLNIAFFGGRKEELSEEEAAHLEESLEMFRLLKAKRMTERKKD
jgi:transcriptional regulator with XRE-family HTH domain